MYSFSTITLFKHVNASCNMRVRVCKRADVRLSLTMLNQKQI